MYHAGIESNGRGVCARISDGWDVSRMYAENEGELRNELRKHRIKPVSELTSKMCRRELMSSRYISIIHKLL